MNSGPNRSPTMSKTALQPIKCKAAVCWGIKEPIKIEEIEVEAPRSSEVRVKMLCSSLCHTDIVCWTGYPLALFPRVLGHEGVGVVESVGEEVTEVKEGDFVIPTYIGECRECGNCTSGKSNLCLKYPIYLHGLMPDNTSRMSVKGQKLYQVFSCATWSEYAVMNINYLVKIDSRVALNHASLISCGFSTGFGAAWKEAKVEKGSTVAVFGLGGVGLGGRGVTVTIGTSHDFTIPISIIPLMLGRTLKGSIFGGIKPRSDLPIIVDKCVNKEIELDAIVTHEVQLDDINKAFELSKQADCVKVMIQIGKRSDD